MNQEQLEKVVARMARIDAMPREIRELVHEFGLTMVQAFLDQKITKPNAIRHLILQVQRGSLDTGSAEGNRGWAQQGRVMVLVPQEPTPAMVHASMATVANHDMVVDKFEKHKLRLKAAIKAGLSRVA